MFSEYFAADMVSLLSVQVNYQYSTPSILTIIPMLGLLFPDQADYFAHYLLNRAFTTMDFDDDTELAYALYDASKLNDKRGMAISTTELDQKRFLARCALSCFDIPMIPYLSSKNFQFAHPKNFSIETVSCCEYITALALASPHWHITKLVKDFRKSRGYDIFEYALVHRNGILMHRALMDVLDGIDNDKISQVYIVDSPLKSSTLLNFTYRLYHHLKVKSPNDQPKYQKNLLMKQIQIMFDAISDPVMAFKFMEWQDKYRYNIEIILESLDALGILTNENIFASQFHMASIIRHRQPFSQRETEYCCEKIPRFMEWYEILTMGEITIDNHAILWRFFRGVLEHHEHEFLILNANDIFRAFNDMTSKWHFYSPEEVLSAKTLLYAFIFLMRLQNTLFAPPVGLEQAFYRNLCSWLGVDGTGNGKEYDYKKYISAEILPRQQPHKCTCLGCKK